MLSKAEGYAGRGPWLGNGDEAIYESMLKTERQGLPPSASNRTGGYCDVSTLGRSGQQVPHHSGTDR